MNGPAESFDPGSPARVQGPASWVGSASGPWPRLAEGVCVWLIDLDSGSRDLVLEDPALAVLSDEEKRRALRLVRPRDRWRFARARTALREILSAYLDRPPQALEFSAIGHGKPVLTPESDPSGRVHFNVSHSGGLALVAVGRDLEIGVDLEEIRPVSLMDQIVETYFSDEERHWFQTLEPAARAGVFFRGWTRKEAVVKARGIGLAGLGKESATGFGAGELAPHFQVSGQVGPYQLFECEPRPGFTAALAVARASD